MLLIGRPFKAEIRTTFPREAQMFRSMPGFKALYGDLSLLIASDFDEWKILVLGPGVAIHGGRQISEGKAKEHARAIAMDYIQQEMHASPPAESDLEWTPFTPKQWLNWRP